MMNYEKEWVLKRFNAQDHELQKIRHENKQLRRANKQHKHDKEIYRMAIKDCMREIENYRAMNKALDDLLAESRKKNGVNRELKKYHALERELTEIIVALCPHVKGISMDEIKED